MSRNKLKMPIACPIRLAGIRDGQRTFNRIRLRYSWPATGSASQTAITTHEKAWSDPRDPHHIFVVCDPASATGEVIGFVMFTLGSGTGPTKVTDVFRSGKAVESANN